MFGSFRKLMADLVDGDRAPHEYGEDDFRLAAATLLVHTATIDGSMAEAESTRLHEILKQRFSLDDASTDELVAEATEAEAKATDLYSFTQKLNRALDDAARARLVEMMWQIVYADGAVTEVSVPPGLDGTFGRLRAVRLAPDGALFVSTSNGDDDMVLRIDPR